MIQAIKRYFAARKKARDERMITMGIELVVCRLLHENPGCAVRFKRHDGRVEFYVLKDEEKDQ